MSATPTPTSAPASTSAPGRRLGPGSVAGPRDRAMSFRHTAAPPSPNTGSSTFKWLRGGLLGEGTYGRVYFVLRPGTSYKKMIAVKQVESDANADDGARDKARQRVVVDFLKSQIEVYKALDHPNVVDYLGVDETPNGVDILMECIPGGSIAALLLRHGRFADEANKSFLGQILNGVGYLHSKAIIHRNIKPSNILVEMCGTCKLSDIGVPLSEEHVYWMAPEAVKANGYDLKVDIWGVGCVALELLTEQRPWVGEEKDDVRFKLSQRQHPPFPQGLGDAEKLLKKAFTIEPNTRPTAAELGQYTYLDLPAGWQFTTLV